MTHFHIEVDLTCPNWKDEDVLKFVGNVLAGERQIAGWKARLASDSSVIREEINAIKKAIVYLASHVDGLMSNSQGGPGIDQDVIEMLKVGE